MNNNVNGININRHPSICVDTIQKVTAHKIENPLREHLKIKNDVKNIKSSIGTGAKSK